MDPVDSVRADKWLWATRIYKTRSLAIEACKAGHVKLAGASIKPARDLRVGEVLVIALGELTKTVKVIGLIERRVGGQLVSQYLEDLTPPVEYEKLKQQRAMSVTSWPKGQGRPTKRNRRLLERLGVAGPEAEAES